NLAHICDFSQVSDSAGVNDCGANEIDELLLNQLLTIENGVEHFSNRQWSRRVLTDYAKAVLRLGRRRGFQPKKMERLKLFTHASSFNGSQAMVRIVQHVHFRPEFLSQTREELWDKTQVVFCRPAVLGRSTLLSGLIAESSLHAADSICAAQS